MEHGNGNDQLPSMALVEKQLTKLTLEQSPTALVKTVQLDFDQLSPTCVVVTTIKLPGFAATAEDNHSNDDTKVTFDLCQENGKRSDPTTSTKDFPMLEDTSGSQDEWNEVEKTTAVVEQKSQQPEYNKTNSTSSPEIEALSSEYRDDVLPLDPTVSDVVVLSPPPPQQSLHEMERCSTTSKLAELLWTRRWERVRRRCLGRHGKIEVQQETDLPCFGNHSRGLPLHLACAMRPLPPACIIHLLVDTHPDAARVPESTWGLLPLHLLADLRKFSNHSSLPSQSGESSEISNETDLVNDEHGDTDNTFKVSVSENSSLQPENHKHDQKNRVDEDDENTDDTDKDITGNVKTDKAHRNKITNCVLTNLPAYSAWWHHGRVVEIILAAFPEGAHVAEKVSGMLPLHVAASTGCSCNGIVTEATAVVIDLLQKHAPETRFVEDDWGKTPIILAWQEATFHCMICGGEGLGHCPHVWNLPTRLINPLLRGMDKDDHMAIRNQLDFVQPPERLPQDATRSKVNESNDRERPQLRLVPSFIHVPMEVSESVTSGSSDNKQTMQTNSKRNSFDEALQEALLEHTPDISEVGKEMVDCSAMSEQGHGHSATEQTCSLISSDDAPCDHAKGNDKKKCTIRGYHSVRKRKTERNMEVNPVNNDNHNTGGESCNPVGKDICFDSRFGPFGDKFGKGAKSLLTLSIQVSHLKAAIGKARVGTMMRSPSPFIQLAIVANGTKAIVYQSHPFPHRRDAMWQSQQISLGLSIRSMYKAACLFSVFHCRRNGGSPLLIGSYYCSFHDLPITPVPIVRGGKPKGFLRIHSFSLEEIPKLSNRIKL